MVDFRKWGPCDATRVSPVDPPAIKVDDGIPKGYVRVTAFTNGEKIVVVGSPMDEDGDEENGHNCDAMGCGWDHILAITDVPEWQRRQLRRGFAIAPPKAAK